MFRDSQSQKMLRVSLSAAGCLSCSKYKLSESSGMELRGRKTKLLSKAGKYFVMPFTDALSKLGAGTDGLNLCVRHSQKLNYYL